MKREELDDAKKKKYDEIVDTMMNEIAEKCKNISGGMTLDGKKTTIYQTVTKKYLPELEALLNE